MSIYPATIQSQVLQRAVLLTGAPRSGTTLLGKIMGSLAGLEYHFEPPHLYMLASSYAAGVLPKDIATTLLQTYLSEDLFLETIHGRTANMRPGDDSQILNRMHWADLNARWQTVGNRSDAIDFISSNDLRFAVKMPHLFDSWDLIEAACPQLTTVVSIRDGVDVVRSIIAKDWVSKEGLTRDLWPYVRRDPEGVNIPYWVPTCYHDDWAGLKNADRACIMWACHAERGYAECAARQGSGSLITIRYEDLLADPWPIVTTLSNALQAPTTLHTQMWVDRIRVPTSMRATRRAEFLANVRGDIADWFRSVNADWGYA